MARILVTGGTSVVGDYLLPRLLAAKHEVTALSRSAHSTSPGVTWCRIDAALKSVWSAALADTSFLIHLAPLPLLTRVLPDAPNSLLRVVAIGTTSVFTKSESRSAKDRNLVEEQRRAEEGFTDFCRTRGVDYTLFRPTLVYDGVHDKNIARIAQLVRTLHFFPVAAPGRGLRQPLHADDLAAVCVAALQSDGSHTYQLAGGETLSYCVMLERIFRSLEMTPRVLPLPLTIYRFAIAAARLLPRYRGLTPEVADRMNQDMVFDYAEAARDLGFNPRRFTP